jgi:predicted SnoaL-like aldol condensation-catalyzing enzyme
MRRLRSYIQIRALVVAAIAVCLALTSVAALAATGPSPSPAEASHRATVEPSTEVKMGQSEKQNLQTVLTAMQVVFTEHRADQIDEFFTEDFIQHSPLVPPENAGREGLKQWLTGIVAAIPDLAYLPAPDQQMTDGDRVLVVAQVRGTVKGDLPLYGIKGSGQKLDVSTSHIFRLEHGKIAEHWEVVDTGPLVMLAAGTT